VERSGIDWNHEKASYALLKIIIKDAGELFPEHLDKAQCLKKIKHMISGTVYPPDEDRPYLYQIVANKLNGLDADKLDYLVRDTHSANLPLQFKVKRLIKFSAVQDLTLKDSEWDPKSKSDALVTKKVICFDRKVALDVSNVFVNRFDLHKEVYSHKVIDGYDLLIADIFAAIKPCRKYDFGALLNVKNEELTRKYARLKDDILGEIERIDVSELNENDRPHVLKAQKLLNDLYSRRHYHLVTEVAIRGESFTTTSAKQVSEDLRIQLSDHLKNKLGSYDDFEVKKRVFDLGGANPLAKVGFFGGKDTHASTFLEYFMSKLNLPIREALLRVYMKRNKHEDGGLSSVLMKEVKNWCRDEQKVKQPINSPKFKNQLNSSPREMLSSKKLKFDRGDPSGDNN
jgi:HD superfamily phosphohydrolase